MGGGGGNLQYPHLALRICSLLACVAAGWMGRINVLYKMHFSELNYSIKIHMYTYYTNSFCIMRKHNNIWEQRTEGLKAGTAMGRLSSYVLFSVPLTPKVMGWRRTGRLPCIQWSCWRRRLPKIIFKNAPKQQQTPIQPRKMGGCSQGLHLHWLINTSIRQKKS